LADRDNGAPAVGLAVASYLVAPAVIHIAHGRAGIAAASVGLRLGLPSAGFLLGAGAVVGSHDALLTALGAGIGAAVGVLSASAIDAAALSWDNPVSDNPVTDHDERSRNDARAHTVAPKTKPILFAPTGGPRREGGFDVGVGAIF
jgi:hypothetical protein